MGLPTKNPNKYPVAFSLPTNEVHINNHSPLHIGPHVEAPKNGDDLGMKRRGLGLDGWWERNGMQGMQPQIHGSADIGLVKASFIHVLPLCVYINIYIEV